MVSDIYGTVPLVLKVHPWAIDEGDANMLFGGNRVSEPVCLRLPAMAAEWHGSTYAQENEDQRQG